MTILTDPIFCRELRSCFVFGLLVFVNCMKLFLKYAENESTQRVWNIPKNNEKMKKKWRTKKL